MSRIQSKGKGAKYYASIKQSRVEWAQSKGGVCMACGDRGGFTGLSIHEIERRSHASDRWACTSSYLLLCQQCHEGPFASMSHVDQLAIKKVRDPSDYDLQKWLRIRDPELRAPRRITEEEVDEAVLRIFGSGIGR
jgi:hypothetical protein